MDGNGALARALSVALAASEPVDVVNRPPSDEGGENAIPNKGMARVTGLEPATSGVTGRRSNQLSYTRLESVRRAN